MSTSSKSLKVWVALILAVSTVSAATLEVEPVSTKTTESHVAKPLSHVQTSLSPSKSIDVTPTKEAATPIPVLYTEPPELIDGGKVIEFVTTSAPLPVVQTHEVKSVTPAAIKSPESKAESPVPKFCEYMIPLCNSTDAIIPKHMVKIQAHFKQMIHASQGKLSQCFLEHFMFDPAAKPLSKSELLAICAAKELPLSNKGSTRAFEVCAAKHWDAAVDKEMDKILVERANCIKNHNHTVNSTVAVPVHAPELMHDDGDLSIINEIVNKMLAEDKNQLGSNPDIKMIDVSSYLETTRKPVVVAPHPTVKHVVSITTIAPVVVASNITEAVTSEAPAAKMPVSRDTITITAHPSVKPIILGKPSAVVESIATDAPVAKVIETKPSKVSESSLVDKIVTEVAAPTTLKPLVVVAPKTSGPSLLSKNKIQINTVRETTAAPSIATKIIKTVAPTTLKAKAALNPIDALEVVLKRQEKEKIEFDARLKAERESVMKQLQKQKQGEIEAKEARDAKDAIKALQVQRDASSAPSPSVTKLHQMEHERQMAMDPIGHTIKHQQYEISKQQRNG